VRRYVTFLVFNYPFLGAAALWRVADQAWRNPRNPGIWQVQFLFALCSGFMGSLDPGSSNNVYIPVGAWCILLGVWGIHDLMKEFEPHSLRRFAYPALAASFVLFASDPRPMVCSPKAPAVYEDFLAELEGLGGPVYAPSLGQLPGTYKLFPAANWVALDDMVRGPGKDTRDQPVIRGLLAPSIRPAGPAFLLTNHPIDGLMPVISFLKDYYVLDQDYGTRFEALRVLPGRWDHRWPRYLYRYQAPGALAKEVGAVSTAR
jgi:hypothetical protein